MSTRSLISPLTSPALFNDFFSPWNEWFDSNLQMKNVANIPPVNITGNKDHYTVSLAVPGYKKDDFDIAVEGNMLTISSEKKEEKEEANEKFTRKEYSYSSFSRSFHLPEEVKKDDIAAHYDDGVLEIKLPWEEGKKKAALSKKIQVK